MDKFYQVFVSSTFADLEDERKKVSDTLAKAGLIPAGMELFPATSLQQLQFIKKVIDRCDYYVVIVGARYGSLDGDQSFTEKEYEYALSKGIPILAFIHKNPGAIAAAKTETEPKQVARLEAFRARLKTGRVVHFWTDINDLCMNVLVAVTSEITLSPGVGWVRGDQAIDPKVVQEIEKVRFENDDLKKRLTQLEAQEASFSMDIAGPDDHFTFEIYWWIDQPHTIECKLTIKNIFIAAYDAILKGLSEAQIGNAIASSAIAETHPDEYRDGIYYRIQGSHLELLRFQLEALGLIVANAQHSTESIGPQSFQTDYLVWVLTTKGRSYMSKLRAIPRPTTSSQDL